MTEETNGICELPTCGGCGEQIAEPMREEECTVPGCGRHFHARCFADHWHEPAAVADHGGVRGS